MSTGIQWTNETWNPLTGCSKLSQGCKNCYAERIWKKVYGSRPFNDVRFHEDRLEKPLHWKNPKMIFVNSMSDLFHEYVSDSTITLILAAALAAPQHTYQILTKRAKRMLEYLTSHTPADCYVAAQNERAIRPADNPSQVAMQLRIDDHLGKFPTAWPKNLWFGVSVEDQRTADERIPLLLQCPVAIRWISAEPLLEALLVKKWLWYTCSHCGDSVNVHRSWLTPVCPTHGDVVARRMLDWVVVGGESGTKAKSRKFDLAWVYDIKRQCQAAKVPLFVKQMGRNPYFSGGAGDAALVNISGITDSHGGNMNEWPEDLRIREMPA